LHEMFGGQMSLNDFRKLANFPTCSDLITSAVPLDYIPDCDSNHTFRTSETTHPAHFF
jgi:hypothetical protein